MGPYSRLAPLKRAPTRGSNGIVLWMFAHLLLERWGLCLHLQNLGWPLPTRRVAHPERLYEAHHFINQWHQYVKNKRIHRIEIALDCSAKLGREYFNE